MKIATKFKEKNPSFFWCSNHQIDDFLHFLKSKGFKWNERYNTLHNAESNITIESLDFPKIMEKRSFLDKKIKEEKRRREKVKENLTSDDARVAGYIINFLISAGIINLFLGWIFLNLFLWITLQILTISTIIAFFKLRIKIIKKIKNVN